MLLDLMDNQTCNLDFHMLVAQWNVFLHDGQAYLCVQMTFRKFDIQKSFLND